MKQSDMKVGSRIWYEDCHGFVQSGELMDIYPNRSSHFFPPGTVRLSCGKSLYASDCYETEEQACAVVGRKSDQEVLKCCAKIGNVMELLQFMYENMHLNENRITHDRKNAAAIRAKELVGIDLDSLTYIGDE